MERTLFTVQHREGNNNEQAWTLLTLWVYTGHKNIGIIPIYIHNIKFIKNNFKVF